MLVLGVVLAVAAFGGVLIFGAGAGSAKPSGDSVKVVTAAVDVALGTALDATQLTTVDWPVADAVDTYRDTSQVVGQVVRRTVHAGEAFRSTDFTSTGGVNAPDVSGNLKAGQVAITVSVDSVTGVANLLQPGDAVDVILAISDTEGKAPVVIANPNFGGGNNNDPVERLDDFVNNTTVKTIVQNVQVLGTTLPAADEQGSNNQQVDPETGAPLNGKTLVVLSVTPQEAEIIRFTALDGNLTLVLRSPLDKDAADVDTTGVTLRELVDDHGVLPPRVVISKFP